MKKYIGIKYSHDAGVAIVRNTYGENGNLDFACEVEKLNNNKRYSKLSSLSEVFEMIGAIQIEDQICVDGWTGEDKNPNSENGTIENWDDFPVAGYQNLEMGRKNLYDPIRQTFNKSYKSYSHLMGHIYGSYMTSPFGLNKERTYILVSDGGILPTIFLLDPYGSPLPILVKNFSQMSASVYGVMSLYFGPYKDSAVKEGLKIHGKDGNCILAGYDVPGKIMSYIGLGSPCEELCEYIYNRYKRQNKKYVDEKIKFYRGNFEHEFLKSILEIDCLFAYKDADILASIHKVIERMYIEAISEIVPAGSNFIFTGGAALNIKWNTAIRNKSGVGKMYVPPFPNDSGSCIGAACAAFYHETGKTSLSWKVYSGPDFINEYGRDTKEIFNAENVGPYELGRFIAQEKDDAFLILHGRAEIGPRALGHRSIFMSPVSVDAKHKLNKIKNREHFRPVAPICLEEDAQHYFSPGTPDKFMIFEHEANDRAKKEIPATIHLDGTSRLQTVNKSDCNITHAILLGFKSVTSFGIMCNTSANFNGSGFLPNLSSAILYAETNGIRYIWTDRLLIDLQKVK